MIRPTMSHAVDKQHLHELISVYATNLERKIAELEKERDDLHTRHYRIINYCTILTPEKLEAHNLEQQIGAISDYSESLLNNLNTYSVDDVNAFEESYINALRNQAKALKEQGK